MSIAITGSTGFVGRTLVDLALAQGLTVRALARRAQEPRKGVTWIEGDLGDRAALTELVAGTQAVIHAAGLIKGLSRAQFEAVNVRGTMAVVQAAMEERVPRLVFVSSLSAREPTLSAYGTSKSRAERLVRAAAIDWTIVRPPAVYGPHDRDMYELFRAAKWGVVPLPGRGRASLIHVEDLARLLLTLVPAREATTHAMFEPDDGTPGGWDNDALVLAIGAAVGRRPRVLRVSRRMMEGAAKLDTWLRGDAAKLTLDRVGYLSHPDWVVSAGSAPPRDLWQPRIETREGLKQTARWYREQGWL
jgi:nucleoside-diphosphate-sugar epimerase